MRVLVVGQGGREHAIVASLARNPTVDRIYAAPGNAGLAELSTCVSIGAGDVRGLAEFAERESIDLTVVGPEAPLVAGLVDELEGRGLRAFGPTKAAARIEGSKVWAKEFCGRHGIPAAASRSFTDYEDARGYLESLDPPYVVKADGLASGKGVTVAEDRRTAEMALRASLIDRAFGRAGTRILIEEYLEGREVSALALTDGREVRPLALARDYKRLGDADTGPNTGGMGGYSPVPFVDRITRRRIVDEVLVRTVRGLESEGIRYRGVLYAGLMMADDGPRVLEFNCRFGDPEAQAILPRLTSDLGELLLACAEGNLGAYRLHWSPHACVTVVMASAGYPSAPRTGVPIEGLEEARAIDGVHLFHAGTTLRGGRVTTAGGRVLAVSGVDSDLVAARARAYEACNLVSFEGMHYRRDIAADVSRTGDG
jgi:phosphoribosylamine---glycine ligase